MFTIDRVFNAFDAFDKGYVTLEELRSDVFEAIADKEYERMAQEAPASQGLADFREEA